MFNKDVYKGTKEQYNEKLRRLAELAEPEKWTFAKIERTEPYKILQNYISFTYNRLEEEGKLEVSGSYMSMNTGLLTVYKQEIVGVFTKYSGPFDYKWFLIGFYKTSDRNFTANFSSVPLIADYTQDAGDLVYDRHLKIIIQKEHIINDNYERFLNAGYNDKEVINALLDNAIKTVELKLARNYKLALPFWYHNTETNEKTIQLLAPLYMAGACVKLAIVLSKKKTENDSHYEAITVLPVDWAYMNSRVIVKPEEEWAKIVDEVDVVDNTSDDSENTVDK